MARLAVERNKKCSRDAPVAKLEEGKTQRDVDGAASTLRRTTKPRNKDRTNENPESVGVKATAMDKMKPTATPAHRKRRVLGQKQDNPLLRPFNARGESDEQQNATAQLLRESSQVVKARTLKSRAVKQSQRTTPIELEHEINSEEEESSLSDFIVSDSDFSEEEEDSDLAEDYGWRAPSPSPPRRRRRLVRGRKPEAKTLDTLHNDFSNTHSQPSIPHRSSSPSQPTSRIKETNSGTDELTTRLDQLQLDEKDNTLRELPDLDEPLPSLHYSPPRLKSPKKLMNSRPTTPPASPSKDESKLLSPRKPPKIPGTPHRPSMDAFWSQDLINEWNDKHSPRKDIKSLSQSPLKKDTAGGDDLFCPSPQKKVSKRDKIVTERKKAFEASKHSIAVDFLTELDQAITNGQISDLTASTGGVKIIWSKKLNTTAGRANWRRDQIRSVSEQGAQHPQAQPTQISIRHHASIELAEKVIDDEERLVNVLAHEFCHLATFIISGVKDNPHGKEFKAWGAKCSQVFAHRGIEVTTKHSYVIDFKYVWECKDCQLEYKRHSKSIDPVRHRCGSCKGILAQIKPAPRATGKASEYQMFVKANLKKIKEENPNSPQKEIMALVGKRYREQKEGREKEILALSVNEGLPAPDSMTLIRSGSTDSTGSSGSSTSSVARRLDFVDLTL